METFVIRRVDKTRREKKQKIWSGKTVILTSAYNNVAKICGCAMFVHFAIYSSKNKI